MENKNTNSVLSQNCERCGTVMICNSKNISECDCSKIKLSEFERDYLQSKFRTCLCNTCLVALKKEMDELANSKKEGGSLPKISQVLILLFLVITCTLSSQSYAPPAGMPGTTAMHLDSSVFVAWASTCSIQRGYQNSADQSLGLASVGEASFVIGKALMNGVVSLGDGGSAICQFNLPIRNGSGFDFAVFENAIDDTFLELAFVEVSSDGVHFFRFKSHSLTDTVTQTNGFGATDATKINNLAGKYRSGFGTPFDLQELEGIEGLDVNSITHIKIRDVVGAIDNTYASRDGFGNKINDPWPTPFPSGGFDLDAVGVIHVNSALGLNEAYLWPSTFLYPNPVNGSEDLFISCVGLKKWELYTISGEKILMSTNSSITLPNLLSGIYTVKIEAEKGVFFSKLVLSN